MDRCGSGTSGNGYQVRRDSSRLILAAHVRCFGLFANTSAHGAFPKSTASKGPSGDEPLSDICEQLPAERSHEFIEIEVGQPVCASRITSASRPARIS